MTMNGGSGKYGDFPLFNVAYKGYPGFKRQWHTFQSLYYSAMLQRELTHLFPDNCLDKKVADKIRRIETMAACWRMLDSFYNRPKQFARDLMAEISAFKKLNNWNMRDCSNTTI